jgi:hypothetical protein
MSRTMDWTGLTVLPSTPVHILAMRNPNIARYMDWTGLSVIPSAPAHILAVRRSRAPKVAVQPKLD